MNLHPYSIACGIILTSLYVIKQVRKSDPVNAFDCAVMFLGGYAFVGGMELLFAAWKSDPSVLPADWPEYIGAAGVAGMGLSLEQFFKLMRSWGYEEDDSKPKKRIKKGPSLRS